MAFSAKFREETGEDPAPYTLQALRWYYILETIGHVGYKRARTSETISEYTAKGVERLGRDSGQHNARGTGNANRGLGDARGRQRRQGQEIGSGSLGQVASGSDGGVAQYSLGQVASTEFRNGFGASRVVGEDGSPVVVYRGEHGIPSDQGIQSLLSSVTLTDDPEAASTYAISPSSARIESGPIEAEALDAAVESPRPAF